MKLLLVYPNIPLMLSPSIALGLFTAIARRSGCEVKVFETTQYSDDYNNRHIRLAELGAVRGNSQEELEKIFEVRPADEIIPDYHECLRNYKPDVILMSVLEDVWPMAQIFLKEGHEYNIPTVLGGVFPTAAPEIVMANPYVKYVALHEGEGVVKDICEGKELTTIDNVIWKDDFGQTHKNSMRPLCDIRHTIPDFSEFHYTRWQRPMGGRVWDRALSMETYRGCPYNCTFCNSPNTREFSDENYLRRLGPPDFDWFMHEYKRMYNPDFIMFQDDSFLARPHDEVRDYCEILKYHGIPFWFNTRIENAKPDLLQYVKDAGCFRMTFGIESGNEKYRSTVLKRQITNERYIKHLKYINESNIPYSLNIIIGFPFETRKMVLDGARLVKIAGGYDGLMVSMFQPYHGTGLRKLAVDNGFLPPDYVNCKPESPLGGGYLNGWQLNMPEPFLQKHDVEQLVKTFALYAYFPENRWAEVERAETDNDVFSELMEEYKENFLTEEQLGGSDRFSKGFCAKHDPSSTYRFV